MPDCDGYFDQANIPFEPSYQDTAVYWVWSDPHLEYGEKKPMIMCWFDTTYGNWNGFRYDLNDSRQQMSAWLKANGYATFEAFLEDKYATDQSQRFQQIRRQV